jgi:hypothetical protein
MDSINLKEYRIIRTCDYCHSCGRSEFVSEKLTGKEVEEKLKNIKMKHRVFKEVNIDERL